MRRLGILARSHFALRDLQWRLLCVDGPSVEWRMGGEGGVECIGQLGLAFAGRCLPRAVSSPDLFP